MVGSAQVPPDLLRITVASSTRSVDVAVPSCVALADLLPELARAASVLDRTEASAGYHALTRAGRPLHLDVGLAAQGVEDGAVVVIASGIGDPPPQQYDDPAELVVQAVQTVQPWTDVWRRRTYLPVGSALLLAGAVVLAGAGARGVAAGFGAGVAAALVLVAAGCSRARREPVPAAVLAHLGCLYAAAASLGIDGGAGPTGGALVSAGGGVLAAGMLAVLALSHGRVLMLPALVIGAGGVAAALLASVTGLRPAVFLTGWLAVAVLTGGRFPALALGVSGTGRHAWRDDAGLDPVEVAEDLGRARELLMATSATLGAVLVFTAPWAVTLGSSGAAVPLLACAIVALRARRYRAAVDVLTALASSAAGVVMTSVSMLWLTGWWRPWPGIAVALLGIATLVAALRPPAAAVQLGRAADVLERVALAALLPATLVSIGVSIVQG